MGSALEGSTPVGNEPSALAVDPATDTVYVANGFDDNGPEGAGGDTVSVIDIRHCDAEDLWRCKGPWPTVMVGSEPSNIAIDYATGTVYVDNTGGDTVSVFSAATCNAMDTSGCSHTPASVPVGAEPEGIYVDDANHTVYVGDTDGGNGNDLSMINSATCNASDLATCPATQPPTVNVGSPVTDIVADAATQSVYVATFNDVAVFNGSTCNATDQSGCGTLGTLPPDPDGDGPNGIGIDPANDTLYAADYDNTVGAWDMADCNASNLAQCANQTPGIVTFGGDGFEHALWLVVDVPLHSVYVTYQYDDALVVIDTNVCNGADPNGCATLDGGTPGAPPGTVTPPVVPTGSQPQAVDLDVQTQTLYVANQFDNDVSVIDATRCNAQVTNGCRQAPPAIPVSTNLMAVDPAVNTLYATSPPNAVQMINTLTCSRYDVAGCAATLPQATVGTYPQAVAVDGLTHTVYVVNYGSTPVPSTVSVINADTCNAAVTAGCSDVQTLPVPGGNAVDVAVDSATDTVYVATTTASGPDLLSVYDGATCNASDVAGCNQAPATVEVGNSAPNAESNLFVAVDQVTNTVYATNTVLGSGGDELGTSVYVINGTNCDAAGTTGCNQVPSTITVGPPVSDPAGLVVDQSTDSVYVALDYNGDYPGELAVINGATCNSANVTGCAQVPQTVAMAQGPYFMDIDQFTNDVYVANINNATLSVIDGNICNGTITFGCRLPTPELPAGTYPGQTAVDAASGTAYVATFFGISVVPLWP